MNISYFLIDLDNTLYRPSNGLFDEINRRMTRFVSEYLGIDEKSSAILRNEYAVKYGTTLGGLMRKDGLKDPEPFLDEVHPTNIKDYVEKNTELKPMLKMLPYPCAIFSNSPMEHVERVLDQLGVHDCFEHLFDIRFSGFLGKPFPSAYERVLDIIGKQAEEVLFLDDVPHYLTAFREMGGEVLLVSENGAGKKEKLPHISNITELPEFLKNQAD